MKITDVKTFVVDGVARPWTFVKVETDSGIVGWGDCTEWDAWPAVVGMIDHQHTATPLTGNARTHQPGPAGPDDNDVKVAQFGDIDEG